MLSKDPFIWSIVISVGRQQPTWFQAYYQSSQSATAEFTSIKSQMKSGHIGGSVTFGDDMGASFVLAREEVNGARLFHMQYDAQVLRQVAEHQQAIRAGQPTGPIAVPTPSKSQ